VKLVSRVGEAGVLKGDAAFAFRASSCGTACGFRASVPGEQLGFDGSKFLPVFYRRPALGLSLYLEQQNTPLRDGLLGGTLSTAWTMLRLDN